MTFSCSKSCVDVSSVTGVNCDNGLADFTSRCFKLFYFDFSGGIVCILEISDFRRRGRQLTHYFNPLSTDCGEKLNTSTIPVRSTWRMDKTHFYRVITDRKDHGNGRRGTPGSKS